MLRHLSQSLKATLVEGDSVAWRGKKQQSSWIFRSLEWIVLFKFVKWKQLLRKFKNRFRKSFITSERSKTKLRDLLSAFFVDPPTLPGFLSHLEHAAGPVPDPFPDPLPGPFPDHLEEGSQAHVTAVRSHAHAQRSALGKCQWVLRWQDSLLQLTYQTIKKSERCSKLIFPQQRGDSSLYFRSVMKMFLL